MKKVSVIVPVYDVERYVERCLNSLVNQTLDDIEIIMVNDGSPDNSQDIIDEYMEKYPDKIVSIQIENSGIANARNVGLERATGEYIGFVDSDDFIEITMYENLYNKAMEEAADIVVCGFTKLYVQSSKNFNLGNTEYFGTDLKNSPDMLVKGVPYVWNKIFKRDIIEKHHVRFKKFRIFEDLLFTYECFLYAKCISKVDKPLCFYRARRAGSATNAFSDKFYDIFPVMDLLNEVAKETNQFDLLEEQLTYTALNHIIIRWEKKVSIEELPIKQQFFDESFKYIQENYPHYKTHQKFFEEYTTKNPKEYFSKRYWKKRFKEDIITQEEPMSNKEKRIDKFTKKFEQMKEEFLSLFQKKKINAPYVYLNYVKTLPVDEKAMLFDPQHGADMNGNVFYLLKEIYFNSEYEEFTYYIGAAEERIKEFKEKLDNYGIKNVKLLQYEEEEYLKVLASAKYIFTDTSMQTYFMKREEQVYYNTWHGTPFKTLGRSSRDEMHRIGNLQRNFRIADYILYPSEYMKEHMLEDYMLKDIASNQIIMSGYPRNTIFFEEPNKKIQEEEGMIGKQVMAYLPTWRGSLNRAEGEDEIIGYLREMDESIEDNQLCYVNLHPYLKGSVDFSEFKNLRLIPAKYETYDFLNCCDVLITDYSSVFFDFANTRKKIVLFAYDEEEYFRDRGVYFGFDELPFTKVTTVVDLMKAVKEPINYDDTAFMEKFCPYDSKDAAKEQCEYIVRNKENSLEIQDMPNNGLENVVIFAGSMKNNFLTDKLFNSLQEMDLTDRNYFLLFRAWKLGRNKHILRTIPENIRYISQLGGASTSDEEKEHIERYCNSRGYYAKNKEVMEQIFADERRRFFEHTKIDKIIYYGAMDCEEMAILGGIQCEKLLYIPNKKVSKAPASLEVLDMYDEIIVGSAGAERITLKRQDASKVKLEECKEEILRFGNNSI